jgi:hypothetical protein
MQLPELRGLSLYLQNLHEEQQQQQQGQQAQLAEDAAVAAGGLALALSALTSLRKLFLDIQLPAAAFDMLPASLQELTLVKLPSGTSWAHLKQLRQLRLGNSCCDAAGLAAAIAALPQLQQLQLEYHNSGSQAAQLALLQQHAEAWHGLQPLQHLVLELQHQALTGGEAALCST